jgi:rSAM/selenodomain-associated transferase 2
LLSDIDTPEDLEKLIPQQIPQRPYISVVIPAFNEEKRIGAGIVSACDPDAEIIVVDGGSEDRTVETAQSLGAKVITGPKGRSLQQNFGAKHATGETLLFLHADSRLPEKYAAHVFDALLDSETVLGAFGFKTTIHGDIRMKLIEIGVAIRSSLFGLPYGDQGLFMHRKDFLQAGGFPEVPIAEDLLLVRRLSRKGKTAIAPAAVVTSGRRWRHKGIFRTFLINQVILGACLLGVSPDRLAPLYRTGRNPVNRES